MSIDRTSVRLGVISPLARRMGTDFLGARWGEVEVANTPHEVRDLFERERRRCDVVLVDLMWNSFADEWSFDGLDVLGLMGRRDLPEPALLACQGHGFERDFLEEGRHHPLARGMVVKSDPGPVLLEAIDTIVDGRRFTHPELDAHLRPERESIGYWFAANPLLARTAGAIAAGHGGSYADLAEVLGVSVSTVEKSPALFREVLAPRGEINRDGDVSQAAVFRWCGEHAHYILSWCRRHRDRYRELATLADNVLVRQTPRN